MFEGFAGWHVIIVIGVLLLIVGIVALIVVIATRSRVGSGSPTPPRASQQPIEARLAELDSLRSRGVISDSEYASRRAAIIAEI